MSRKGKPRDRITRTRESMCPRCGYVMTAIAGALGPEPEPPRPGDWTVCARCAEPLVLGAELRPEAPPMGAYEALRLTDPQHHAGIEAARARFRLFNATSPTGGFGGSQQQGKA